MKMMRQIAILGVAIALTSPSTQDKRLEKDNTGQSELKTKA